MLAKVRLGSEIVIEQDDHRPLAVIKLSKPVGRMISEVIDDLKARDLAAGDLKASGSNVVMYASFGDDIEEGIKAHQQLWNPPSWE